MQKDFAFTHDLVRLGGDIPTGFTSPVAKEDLAWLSRWAVEPRYPEETEPASAEDALRALEIAKTVLSSVRASLASRGAGSGRE